MKFKISEIKFIYFLSVIFFLTIVLESRSEKFELKYVDQEEKEKKEMMEKLSCRIDKDEDEDKPLVKNNLLGCNYIYKSDICYLEKPVCVCVPHNSTSYYFLEKTLNKNSCEKAYKAIEKKRDKIIDRCIDKAGKMNNELAYKQKLKLCMKMNLPESPFE